MSKGSRLPHRLGLRWPAWLAVGGPVLVTAVLVTLGLFALNDASLKPDQRTFTLGMLGALSLLCVVALARPAGAAVFARATSVEVSLQPARRGEPLRCFVVQRGAGVKGVDVRLQCLREIARGNEETVVDLPVGAAGPTGLRVQLDAEVRVPADAPASEPFRVRWRIRVAAAFEAVPEIVREFPLKVV
ncbi:MAG TPA: hypothetical protein VF950_15510 [Planctomycetota bacterium]